jgi:hypothetical protein
VFGIRDGIQPADGVRRYKCVLNGVKVSNAGAQLPNDSLFSLRCCFDMNRPGTKLTSLFCLITFVFDRHQPRILTMALIPALPDAERARLSVLCSGIRCRRYSATLRAVGPSFPMSKMPGRLRQPA